MDLPAFPNTRSRVWNNLDADIDVTARAIARVVGSLTGDPAEQAAIISAAASQARDMLVAEEANRLS